MFLILMSKKGTFASVLPHILPKGNRKSISQEITQASFKKSNINENML